MSDLTRSEAINWCINNMADFGKPSPFPPPPGWMWAESGGSHVLAPMFTITDQGDEITAAEVGMLPPSHGV